MAKSRTPQEMKVMQAQRGAIGQKAEYRIAPNIPKATQQKIFTKARKIESTPEAMSSRQSIREEFLKSKKK